MAFLTAAVAQEEDDKGFLTRTIQNALSGAGRTVSIDGFAGALSSAASFERMTISDDEGIWLTLTEVELVWTRTALLRGRLEVESLNAKRLDVPRLPVSETETLPNAEASAPFALPDLPVSVNIADFEVEEINLGAPVLGEDAQLKVAAKAQLNDDVAEIAFIANRTDGKGGDFEIKADYQRSDNVLDLLVKLEEDAQGIVSRLLNLPGQPSIDMSVAGQGPLTDFATDLRIATDGEERLSGEVRISAEQPRQSSSKPNTRVVADIGGDITALLAPRYRDFFGTDVRLTVDGLREDSGAMEIQAFDLQAQAANLTGEININAESWPTFMDIQGTIANPAGSAILLPVGGAGTTVEKVALQVAYDAANGETFKAGFDIEGLATDGIEIAQTKLDLDGILQGNLGSVGQFLGDLNFAAEGLVLADTASAEAVGNRVTAQANINFIEGQPIRFGDLNLSGEDYALTGRAVLNNIEMGLLTRLDMALTASDLSRFSALAGRELDGQTSLALKGTITPLTGAFELDASGSTQDLRLGIEQADAVLAGLTQLSVSALRDETGTFLRDLVLENDALSLTGAAELRTDDSQVDAAFRLNDLSLVVPQYEGPVSVVASATQDAQGWRVDASTDGPYDAQLTAEGLATGPNAALRFTAQMPDVRPFAAGFNQDIDGALDASGTLSRRGEGWHIETQASGPYQGRAALVGDLTPVLDLNFDAALPNLQPLVPQVTGPVAAKGRLRQTDQGFFIDTSATGPNGLRALVEGLATGPDMSLTFDVALPDVSPYAPGINGPLSAKGVVRQTDSGIAIDTNATGPYGARAKVEGLATGPDMALSFDVAMPNVSPLVAGVNGPFDAKGVVRQTDNGIAIESNATGPYASSATVEGVVTGDNAAVDFKVGLPNVGVFVDGLSGPLDLAGSARKQGTGWRLDTLARGPAGTQSTVAGVVNTNGTADLSFTGSVPLGLSSPFIEPRSLQGLARFDLALNGPLALSSLSGTVTAANAILSAPDLRAGLTGVNLRVQLGNNRANLDISGNAQDGGRLRVAGGITLTSALPADLAIALESVVLSDPRLYRTSISGDLRLAGPLTGGASISGALNVGTTEINVPSTGLTSIGTIPQITQVGAPKGVVTTRAKAGLTGSDAGSDPAAKSNGSGFGLNVRVNAPNRIFVRGRGLDAELGGAVAVTGTTNNVVSTGRFDLIRGRLDILGKRFDLREGAIKFQGDLVPYLRFVSAAETTTGEVRVIVEGPSNEPEITFESTPDGPSDEVLSQLLFGRNISEISAFQALQLASAVATLAGKGGTGIISNLRNGFGLDDLDVTTTEDGATALRAGKYLSDNLYTDVTAASDGTAEVTLNLDITQHLKARGTLGSDGDSGIGIFFEKDY